MTENITERAERAVADCPRCKGDPASLRAVLEDVAAQRDREPRRLPLWVWPNGRPFDETPVTAPPTGPAALHALRGVTRTRRKRNASEAAA